jgi:predicted hydrolase (HD superfamily)
MGLKDDVTKVVDKLKDAAENVKDAVSEGIHRATAQVEQQKRGVAGDEMTTGEKASSMIKQEKQTVQADIDAMKRDDRNKT